MQDFMTDAGQEGVLLVSFGTIAELGAALQSGVRATCIECLHSSQYQVFA